MSNPAAARQIFEAPPWLVVLEPGDVLERQQFLDEGARRAAEERLRAGEPTAEALGWTRKTLALASVRSVGWVPEVRTVVIRAGWWREPWRLTCRDEVEGRKFFETLAARLPHASPPSTRKVGPYDLAVEPQIAAGVVFTFCGFLALVGGALEGVGQAPVSLFEWFFVNLGQALGLTVVLSIGAAILLAGLGALALWYRRRPELVVVTRTRPN